MPMLECRVYPINFSVVGNFTNSLYKCVTISLVRLLKTSAAKCFDIPKMAFKAGKKEILMLTDGLATSE